MYLFSYVNSFDLTFCSLPHFTDIDTLLLNLYAPPNYAIWITELKSEWETSILSYIVKHFTLKRYLFQKLLIHLNVWLDIMLWPGNRAKVKRTTPDLKLSAKRDGYRIKYKEERTEGQEDKLDDACLQ